MRIKYITLNIWRGGELYDNIVEFIRQERPDIIGLQEVYHSPDMRLESRYRSFNVLKRT